MQHKYEQQNFLTYYFYFVVDMYIKQIQIVIHFIYALSCCAHRKSLRSAA